MFVTAGGFDESLLRGYNMGQEPVTRPPRPVYLTVAWGRLSVGARSRTGGSPL
jgi:hypothetical protein